MFWKVRQFGLVKKKKRQEGLREREIAKSMVLVGLLVRVTSNES